MAAADVDVSVIIVSWNVADLLRRCLLSVAQELRGLSSEVFVVDNASSDDSVSMVQELFPWVHLIVNRANPGFAVANNQAMACTTGRVVVLLNPDTEVRPGGLTLPVRFLAAHPEVGAVGPKLIFPDGRIQKECARRLPTLLGELYTAAGLTRFIPPDRLPGHVTFGSWDYLNSRPVDVLLGACMAVPRDVIEQVGGLDERYQLCGEDIDWCCRIRAAGWQVYYLAEAVVMHHLHASVLTSRSLTMVRAIQSTHVFYRAHRGRAYAALYRGLIQYVQVPRLVVSTVLAALLRRRWTPEARRRLHSARLLLGVFEAT